MRQPLLVGTLMCLAACGNPGDRPWDSNGDGLVTACEGLNPQACEATPGCEREQVACLAICRPDGHGGCLPCPQAETCRPVLPPPPGDCSQLSASLCSFVPQCELVVEQVCSAGAAPAEGDTAFAPPLEPRCGNDCHTVQRCQNRQPATCEQLSPEQCLSRPGCAIVHDVAPAFAPCAPGSNCEYPEVDPLPRCITLPTPTTCEQLSPQQCLSKPGCGIVHDVAQGFAPCAPGSNCEQPEVDPLPRCITLPVPTSCEQRDVNACTVDGRCLLERTTAICDVYCTPGSPCPPCATDGVRCVPLPQPQPETCSTRDLNTCELDGLCRVETWACPAVCILLADGGCAPCNAPPDACVPVAPQPPPPSRCALIEDEQSCVSAGCSVVYSDIACAAVCDPLADGGCKPCPNFACVGP